MNLRSADAMRDATTVEPAATPAWIHTMHTAILAGAAEAHVTRAEVATARAAARVTAAAA